jgi:hypothetical protein
MNSPQTCPQCGATFACDIANGKTHCWCMELPSIPKEITAQTAGVSVGCLCPDCLKALALTIGDKNT